MNNWDEQDERDHIAASVQDFGNEYCPKCDTLIGKIDAHGIFSYLDGVDQVMYYNGDKEMVCRACWDRAEAQAQAALEEGR